MLSKNSVKNVQLINRLDGQNGRRIDRITNDKWANNYDYSRIKEGYYYDCHSIRPYDKYKVEIDQIINTFLEG